MPKKIQNVKQLLLNEAKRQIACCGYAATTIRSVADGCNVAVGTVYNYFPSKEMLIASFVAEDWKKSMDAAAGEMPEEPEKILRSVYDLLRNFSEQHRTLFLDKDAEKTFFAVFPHRHKQLRNQIATLLLPACGESCDAFLPSFLAEALLTWTAEGVAFETLFPILQSILAK